MKTFDYFKEICKIPRESGNEEGMRQYLLSWAKENNFEALRDNAGNIIIRTKATEGHENVASVALQGHMDMVCVKTAESKHNFLTDPIEVYQDGDFLRAKDTSLGGDNGIAVAMIMALFTDKEAKHGPLEAIFTFSEETGMDGAFNLDGSLVQSRRLINLDSEEEGVIYIGCAGGIDIVGRAKYELDDVPKDWDTLKICVCGLLGGHSGGEIHQQRANAISTLARGLVCIEQANVPFMLSRLVGGSRRNVIPSAAECEILVPRDCKHVVAEQIQATLDALRDEFRFTDAGLSMTCTDLDSCLPRPTCALDPDLSLLIAKALFACPHGVYSMSKAIPGIVETSDNLAIASFQNGLFEVQLSVRSNIDSAKLLLANKIKVILESFGIDCTLGDGYPSWAPDPDSKLAKLCAKAYQESTGKAATITAIHAGLECGVINSKCPGMDSISIGPNMYDVHSVNEHLSISSVNRTYAFVRQLLSIME